MKRKRTERCNSKLIKYDARVPIEAKRVPCNSPKRGSSECAPSEGSHVLLSRRRGARALGCKVVRHKLGHCHVATTRRAGTAVGCEMMRDAWLAEGVTANTHAQCILEPVFQTNRAHDFGVAIGGTLDGREAHRERHAVDRVRH
jgi:hypothetical protein